MNVYIACSSKNFDNYYTHYKKIEEEIINQGHNIPSNWIKRLILNLENNKNYTPTFTPNLKDEGIKAIDEADCLIAEVSIPSSSVGYQIGHAFSKKIPTLCIYSSEFGEMKAPQVIDINETSTIKIEKYNTKELSKILSNFFLNLPSSKLIKFNFIITPEIEKYINWGAIKENISKSEFLRRKVLNELIKKDLEFLK